MTVACFSDLSSSATALATQVHFYCELVRGSEFRLTTELLPLVKHESVALNLSQVERIDAAGIAALITVYCSSIEAGTDFTIVDPSPHVLELLRIVGLDKILLGGQIGDRLPSSFSHSRPAA
jgi:anti-anti-sigma factor